MESWHKNWFWNAGNKRVNSNAGMILETSSQLQSRDPKVGLWISKPWISGNLSNFKACLTLAQCPGNPSRMVVHLWCQKVRHGWILVWKQNSFCITVLLEHCLPEKGLKSKCCRFYNLHSACSHQRPYFDPTVHFILVCFPRTKATISWFDAKSGSKVYNGICSKMLTGSGNKVLVRQKGLQS